MMMCESCVFWISLVSYIYEAMMMVFILFSFQKGFNRSLSSNRSGFKTQRYAFFELNDIENDRFVRSQRFLIGFETNQTLFFRLFSLRIRIIKKVFFPLTARQPRLIPTVLANDGNAADERSHVDFDFVV